MSDFNDSFSGFGINNQLYNNQFPNANIGNNCINPTTNFNFHPFQNKSALDFQNNFNLFGGNQNQNFNMNSINNLNNKTFNNNNFNNNMHFNNFNINSNKSDITINFRFMGYLNFKVKAKLEEKLIDVIKRFKNNECPKEIKKNLYVALCQGNKITDFNKTLFELNIKDGENILFPKNDNKENKDEEEKYILTQRENEQLELLKLEYNENYLNKGLNNNLKFNTNNIDNKIENKGNINFENPDFLDYLRQRDTKRKGIYVKEHYHYLVYCLTNIDWTCNVCGKIYSRESMKYYCSSCDYSMCENCHYERKYYMKKSFPKGIKPSNSSVNIHFFKSDMHRHRLVFCRPSKYFIFFKSWECVKCSRTFSNKIWCFYCTSCNYNLCCECCGFH